VEPAPELREVWNYKPHEMAAYLPPQLAAGYGSDAVALLSVAELEALR
jgi:hypothetical protein